MISPAAGVMIRPPLDMVCSFKLGEPRSSIGLAIKKAATTAKITRATTPSGLIGQPFSPFSIGPRFSGTSGMSRLYIRVLNLSSIKLELPIL